MAAKLSFLTTIRSIIIIINHITYQLQNILCINRNRVIVCTKRLGSRGLHDLSNQYIFFFAKRYGYCKIGAQEMNVYFFKDFLGLYNGKKSVVQL